MISLFMQGGPSQVDTFDPKPLLDKLHGQHPPASFGDEDFQNGKFKDLVDSGLEADVSRSTGNPASKYRICFRNIAQCADELAVIRSVLSRRVHALAGAVSDQQRMAADRAAEPGLVDSLRPGHARIRICRASWCCSKAACARAQRCMGRDSCRRPIRERRSVRERIRS